MPFQFQEFSISDYMLEKAYISQRPCSFLRAVLENNLKEAVLQADDFNLRNLPAFVAYLYNHTPIECWGSAEKVTKWLTVSNTPTS